jgi:hypothetical protein
MLSPDAVTALTVGFAATEYSFASNGVAWRKRDFGRRLQHRRQDH